MADTPAGTSSDPITEMPLLIYKRDWQRMYDYAYRQRLGDSATVIRRLLEIAEATEDAARDGGQGA